MTAKLKAYPTPTYTESVFSTEEDTLILPDVHAPYYNADWIERCVRVAVKKGVNRVFLPGDWVDSNHASKYGNNAPETLKDEQAALNQLLDYLLEYFDYVDACTGNHEDRMTRVTDNKISTQQMLEAFFGREEGFVIWPQHYGYIYDVWVGHPRGASKYEHVKVGLEQNRSALLAHTHHFEMCQSADGNQFYAQIGWCGDADRTKYYKYAAPGPRAYVNGAAILTKRKDKVQPIIMVDNVLPPESYL